LTLHNRSAILEGVRTAAFEWDRWNLQKNESKHGVSRLEAESAFYDPEHRIFADLQHSTRSERRWILYGRGVENRVLMAGFTVRGARIRVITARPASRKEREVYDKKE
jgi:uncharacterized DUF497 family protein